MRDSHLQFARRELLLTLPFVLATPALALSRSREFPTPAIRRYERETGGRAGVYALNLITGSELRWRADERFIMCSTFKASLAAFVLHRVDHGDDNLDDIVNFGPSDVSSDDDWWAPVAKANLARGKLSVAELCKGAVEVSDNSCANLLLARVGGPAALTSFWRQTGDRISHLEHTEPLLNRSTPGDLHDTTTPRAMANNMRHFLLGDILSQASRAQLASWMFGCKTGGKRLRAGVPRDWRVADKTGSNGKDAGADVGIIWPTRGRPIVVAVYTQGGSPTPTQIDNLIKAAGQAVSEQLR